MGGHPFHYLLRSEVYPLAHQTRYLNLRADIRQRVQETRKAPFTWWSEVSAAVCCRHSVPLLCCASRQGNQERHSLTANAVASPADELYSVPRILLASVSDILCPEFILKVDVDA